MPVRGDEDLATHIYASAYNRAPEFYSFLQTLEAYRTTVKGNSHLILSTDSDFYKYLKSKKP
jgi:membrane protease subunit HflC